jgi:hypothetical protein
MHYLAIVSNFSHMKIFGRKFNLVNLCGENLLVWHEGVLFSCYDDKYVHNRFPYIITMIIKSVVQICIWKCLRIYKHV